MKLLSCHIENFGKLKDFTYFFEDDLNVLFAENGWGKSTFAAFLAVMFYGFDGENRRNEDGNERLRYRPWGGGVYGGSVTWSSGSKTYRMMRTFGARKKDDKFSLYDDKTGFICSDYSDRIGEELFAIDRDSFCRTVFWSQRDHETSATTSIQAKIGDLSAQPDDLPAYDAAVKRLRRETERLRPDRASGLIRKKEDRLTILEAEQARLPALTAQLEESASREQELTRELNRIRLEKQQYALSVPQDPEETAAQKRMQSSRESLASTRRSLSSAENQLSSLKSARRRTIVRGQKVREQYLQVKRDLHREHEASARLQKKRLSGIRAAAAAGILIAVILFALCFAGVLPKPLLILPVLLLAASGWALWYSRRSAGSDNAFVFLAAESENLLLLEEEKERYSASLRSLRRKLARIEEQIRARQILCERLRSRIQKLESAAYADGSSASAGMHSESADMHSVSAGMGSVSADMHPDSAGMHSVSEGTNSAGGGAIPSAVARTLSDFDVREEECRSKLQEIRQQSEDLRGMIRDCRASQESIPALQSEIRDLREQYDTCVKTLSYLEEARNLFTSRYMNPFLRSFRRYYGMLTGQSAESVQTDADLGIMILDQGLPRDPSLMSEGTRDMISLCRRMAMIDAMYPGEKPFLVLDDPFSNLDDERLKGGMRFLHTASLEYQILYLTCHGSRL